MAVAEAVVGIDDGEIVDEPAHEPATDRVMTKRAISRADSLGCPRATVFTTRPRADTSALPMTGCRDRAGRRA
jgi:hypothetical protein